MGTYSNKVILQLADGFSKFESDYRQITNVIITNNYRTEDGQRHALHGLLRRVRLMRHCVLDVFSLIPPETEEVPGPNTRNGANILLHSFAINTFGCLDNLAWIWCHENKLAIKRSRVGLGPKNTDIRETLPDEFREYLENNETWFDHIYQLRHDIAHQIPFYIPPYVIGREDIDKYKVLEEKKTKAASRGEIEEYERIDAEQDGLGKFAAVFAQGPVPGRLYYFHPNLLADFAMIKELVVKLISALNGGKGRASVE